MINVFIIDDSMLWRNSIKKMLKVNGDLALLGEASNPIDAFEKFKEVGLPDVFILDIEMPRMDGLTFLKKIKEQKPIPTIMFSSLAQEGSSVAIEAMELGAFDVILKPKNIQDNFNELSNDFISIIKAAASSKSIESSSSPTVNTQPLKTTNKIVAIGSSTGGVQTLEEILIGLRPNHTPIVITQHMPPGFTKSFAKRLNKICDNSYIKEAQDGDNIHPGQILIAPGNLHLEIKRNGLNNFKAVLKDYPKVSNHKPSVDVLFTSLAKEAKDKGIAVILTGMGKDGALGMKKVKDSGGRTYGQDEKSSVVYGMPKAAFEMGAVDIQLPYNEIANMINLID